MLAIEEAEAAAAAETTPHHMDKLVSEIASAFGQIMLACQVGENQAIRLAAKIDHLSSGD